MATAWNHWRTIALGSLLLSAVAGAAPVKDEPRRFAPGGTPTIEVRERVVDLGQVNRGETVVARFALANVGDATLRIIRAKPG
jgi:hypothetical protein